MAAVHKETDHLRRAFLLLLEQHRRDGSKQTGGAATAKDSVNPFDAADRREAAEQRMLEQRLAAEAVKYQKQQQQLVGSNAPSTVASPSLTTMPFSLGAVGFAPTGSGSTPSSNTTSATAVSSGFNFGSSFGSTTPASSSMGQSFGTNPSSGAGGTSTTAALDLATSSLGTNGFGGFSSPVGGFGSLSSSSAGLNSKKGKKKS